MSDTYSRDDSASRVSTAGVLSDNKEKPQVLFVENVRHDPNIHNPLAHLSSDELLEDVYRFAEQYDMKDELELLQRGALTAQHMDNWEETMETTLLPDEYAALQFEKKHPWRITKSMLMTILVASIGACVQGWDQTGTAGSILSYPVEFGIDPSTPGPNQTYYNWLVGVISAGPYIGACGFACWASDPLNHYIGRRGAVFVAGIFCLACPLGSAFTQNWKQMFIVRILLGFGIGFKEVTAPVFAAENAPTQIRGALVLSWQMWTAFGIFLGYTANLVVKDTGKIAWRLQYGSALIPAVPLLLLIYLCPESPRWLLKKGKVPSAFRSLLRLRRHRIQAARDLYLLHIQIVQEQNLMGSSNYFQRFLQLFYKNRIRQASLASFIVMIAQQMCGINVIAFFSSTIFSEITHDDNKALWSSWGFGLTNFVFAFPAIFTLDSFGRRNLLLFTFPNMFWTLLAAGFCYWIHNESLKLGLVSLFVYMFCAFYSPGEGPVPFTYSAEAFPIVSREVGMAFAVFTNNFFAAILSITFFRIRQVFTIVGTFGFYSGLNILALIWIFLWVPETKQLSLEELDSVFAVPTTEFMKYQITEALPYFVRRWILFDRKAHLRPQPTITYLH